MTGVRASFLKSPFLFVFLAGLYPVTFKAANNWFLLQDAGGGQIAFLFVVPPLLSLATAFVVYGLALPVRLAVGKLFPRAPMLQDRELLRNVLCLTLACAWMIFLLDVALKNAVLQLTGHDFRYRDLFIISCVTVVPSLVVYARKVGVRYLNFVLMALILLSLGGLSFNLLQKRQAAHGDVVPAEARAMAESVRFKVRPNVYLILLDAYTNDAALKNIFRMDNTPFRTSLQERGFRIYDNAYSNYAGTLPSMQSLFTMQHHYYKQSAGMFDSLVARRIIGANDYNPVLDVFKRNGYAVRYIHDSTYECPHPGAAIDSFTSYKTSPLLYILCSELSALRTKLKAVLIRGKNTPGGPANQARRLKDIDTTLQSKGPYFLYLHTYKPGHAPLFPYARLGFFEEEYPRKVRGTNAAAQAMLDLILAKDPGALVVVMGDHGPFRYGDLWTRVRGGEESVSGVPLASISQDLFGIMLAVRYPPGYDKRFDSDVISPVNLFRYLFAGLSGTDEILGDRKPDESYAAAKGLLLVGAEGGKPLPRWTPFTNVSATSKPGVAPRK